MVNKLKSNLKTILIGLLIGMLLELFVFNFGFFCNLPTLGVLDDTSITKEEMEFINWVQMGEDYISELDPIVAILAVDRQVEDLKLMLDISEETIPVSVFYTTEEGEVFGAEKMIVESVTRGENTIHMGVYVHDLRIDLGEMDHLILRDVNLSLTGNKLEFSISHVILVLIIVTMEKLLFSFQRSPDYESM